MVVSGRNALALNNSVLRPKLFLPAHHDSCEYLIKKDLQAFVADLPESVRSMMRFMADPSDYLKPISSIRLPTSGSVSPLARGTGLSR